MNPYIRAAARNEALRQQALEKLQARESEAAALELLEPEPEPAAPPAPVETVDVQAIQRARNSDGTYRADDPTTPDVNEAWEVVS